MPSRDYQEEKEEIQSDGKAFSRRRKTCDPVPLGLLSPWAAHLASLSSGNPWFFV